MPPWRFRAYNLRLGDSVFLIQELIQISLMVGEKTRLQSFHLVEVWSL